MALDILKFGYYQNMLFPYAYNILGSVDESKDVVQEVLGKHLQSNTQINNEKSYLITSVINTSINVKNRSRKIVDRTIELPEPVATEESDIEMHLKDIVSYSLLILLEQLNVKERAVFILKEGFNYSHEEIAGVISGTTENSRKLLSRAKSKLKVSRKINPKLARKESSQYLDRYVTAIRERDISQLEKLFTTDIKVVADGGSAIQVLRNLTEGRSNCIDLLLEVFKKFQAGQNIQFTEVNHQPAILFFNGKALSGCQIFSLDRDRRIYRISAVVDPEKLKNIVIGNQNPS